MPPSAEKLAEIDAQLDAFGKTEQQLVEVVQRAAAVASALAGDDALTALVDGAQEAVAEARAAAKAARPPTIMSRRPQSQASTTVGTPAPTVEPTVEPTAELAEPEAAQPDDEDEALGSGLVEIPEEELRRHDLPPVLNLGDAEAFPSHPPAPGGGLDDAFDTASVSDIHGLSVDELFEDTSATSPPSSGAHDLAELFTDDESIRLSDPELEIESIEQAPAPRPRTVPPPLPPGAMAAKSPPRLDAGVFPDEETDATMVGSIADMMGSDDSFELLVDEDVLELEDVAGTEPPPDEEAEADAEPKGGLISRILGRK